MYICYIDESGTPEVPGNTSHYILAGVSVPIWHWRTCEDEINTIKRRYALDAAEIHSGWIMRRYQEQVHIPNFESMSYAQRRSEVERIRRSEILRLQLSQNRDSYKQRMKTYRKTQPYIHLTYDDRLSFIRDIATTVRNWGFARLFAECINKVHFDPTRTLCTPDEQAFEQLVSRFERFLDNMSTSSGQQASAQPQTSYGLLIHDNNETVAKKHTSLMKGFHYSGTLWTRIHHIIETPLFVSSELTSMVQIADLCAYILRRYLENQEEELFRLIFPRADRLGSLTVGVRHFTAPGCTCEICSSHRSVS
ncbi:MAG: DUF3800 domain-containing protein [Dissulfurispiraceae bacterium]